MYIVKIQSQSHSAWLNEEAAIHQVEVLKEKGYKSAYYVFDETVDTEDGYYYV